MGSGLHTYKRKYFMGNRRDFIIKTTGASIVGSTLSGVPARLSTIGSSTAVDDANIIGPKKGYTPQIGTLISMLDWMRGVVLNSVRGMSVDQLDYIHDDQSNSIGSMLWHLAATERFYQGNTFEGNRWAGLSESDSQKWAAASSLGAHARRSIKGYDMDFYLHLLSEVRDFTLRELEKRDDRWLMIKDQNFWSSPTNNYCKWFHVCEHESNHNGQIKYIKKRINV